MHNHVTVVPSDRLIIVDGAPLQFDFAAPANLHALQWRDGSGQMEWADDYPWTLNAAAYAEEVAPYVALWEAEKARREQDAAAEARREQQARDSSEARAARLRKERDKRLNATDYLLAADYPLSGPDRLKVMAYRQALRDITEQPGFPWHGGDEDDDACPWPQAPQL